MLVNGGVPLEDFTILRKAFPNIGEDFRSNPAFAKELLIARNLNCDVTVESDKIIIKDSNDSRIKTTTLSFDDDVAVVSIETKTLGPNQEITVKNFQFDSKGNPINGNGIQQTGNEPR